MSPPPPLELVCPAGTLASLRAAVDAGADTVYCSFAGPTSARNYPGLNFTVDELAEGVHYAHARRRRVLVAINTYPAAGHVAAWRAAVDHASQTGADAIVASDVAVLDHAASHHPRLRRHLSVLAGATNRLAVAFYRTHFGISRVVLPRIHALEELTRLTADLADLGVETEVFAFGNLGTMIEGRCTLSSYITGLSPNTTGSCAPAHLVTYAEDGGTLLSRLNGVTLNRFQPGEPSGYPSPCKGRYCMRGTASYTFEEPVGLNVIDVLPQLEAAGVRALKIEGRQRSKAYVTQVVTAFRRALDARGRGEAVSAEELSAVLQGTRQSHGAFERGWK